MRLPMPAGSLVSATSASSRAWYSLGLSRMRLKYRDSDPTFGAIDIPLSFTTMTMGMSSPPAFSSASKATPPVRAPSPITATTRPSSPSPRRIASLIPTA